MKKWTRFFTFIVSLIMQALACHCIKVEAASPSTSLTSGEQSRHEMLLSSISSSHAALEGNENKYITRPSNSSQLSINKGAKENKTMTNPSHQFFYYNTKNYFTDRKTSSTAGYSPKRLIFKNYSSAELPIDTVASKYEQFKYTTSSPQHNQQRKNVLYSFSEEPKKMTNLRFNDDNDYMQNKNINSDTDMYVIRDASPSGEQNAVHTSFHEVETKRLEEQYHLEDTAITEIENKSCRLNTEKYDKETTLNTEMSQDNSQFTSLDKDPVVVALAESYKQLSNKEDISTHNNTVRNTYNGKALEHVPVNHSQQKRTISLNDIQNLRFSHKHGKQLKTNPCNHNYEQIISEQTHQTSSYKCTSDKSEVHNKVYNNSRIPKNSSLNNQLKQIIISTTKSLPAMSTEEIDIQSNVSSRQNVQNEVNNGHLLENGVYQYVNTNEISKLATAIDKVQSLKSILTNRINDDKRSKRSLSLFQFLLSKNSDSSSRDLAKDESYLDQGLQKVRNNLATKYAWPRHATPNLLKRPAFLQPRAEEPEADSGKGFLQKQFERAERLSKAFEWFMRFVKVVGQVDSYLTDRIRSAVRTLARLYDGDYDRENSRSCD